MLACHYHLTEKIFISKGHMSALSRQIYRCSGPDYVHMGKVFAFFEKWRSDGLRKAMNSIYKYIFHSHNFIDVPTLRNAFRFRDHRVYTSCDIEQLLPKSTNIRHPVGVVVNNKAKIGENVSIAQNVTIGSRRSKDPSQPTINDNVEIYANSVIIGDVTLHRGCTIGAHSVVLEDVDEGKTVAGSPASEI